MNLGLMIKMLRDRGFDEKFIENRLRTFVGLKMPMIEKYFESHAKSAELKTEFRGKKEYFE